MADSLRRNVTPVPLAQVKLQGGFWADRVETNRRVTLPIEYRNCRETGRIDAFRLDWQEGQPNPPHIFWDSDVAKWLEACAYSLQTHPDPSLQAMVDEVVELIVNAQQPDGYLNVHFTVVEPEKRWTNLRDWHELYCAGHLMEAATALADAGDRRLLGALRRYADYIGQVFGRGDGQRRGYPGHEEIELALVKLYRATGEQRFLDLSRYFVDERGQQPHYFELEARERGQDPGQWHQGKFDYNQSHLPVREQATAEGHSVRAMYLYCGMADLAAETGDEALWAACNRLWENVTERRMYLTGGVGSSGEGERFTTDFDLPNQTAYTETCAAIGLVFWAHRMLQVSPDRKYADVMERALYNGVLSGISLSGDHFFYANPLRVDPKHHVGRFAPERQAWFGCACCPPNIARLLASFGEYLYGTSDETLYVHLYAASALSCDLGALRVETAYPWDGTVKFEVTATSGSDWTLALRIPGWAAGWRVTVNGELVEPEVELGYAKLARAWRPGDVVTLELPLPARRVVARPEITADVGRVAVLRGPLVYCLEEVDNGAQLEAVSLPDDATLELLPREDLLGGCVTIVAPGRRLESWQGEPYADAPAPEAATTLTFVPYALWNNRGLGELNVWLRRGQARRSEAGGTTPIA